MAVNKIILRAKEGPYKGELAIDLGFSNYFKPAKLRFNQGDIVETRKDKIKKRKDGTVSDLFTYEAYVFQVIDGDTFTAVIDLGFGFTTTQTLRLRGLDAPEIESKEGREAKEFLERKILSGKPVLIRTVKSDKYDRYLADVFIGDDYLNQELIANNPATLVGV